MTEKEITIELKNPEIWILISILIAILFFELIVTFNTPISFGDEGFHAGMARWISENVEYPTWIPFSQTANFKRDVSSPPYLHLLIASFLYLFGFNEVFIRFLPPFISFLTGLAVFLLGKELYNKKVGFIGSIISVAIPSFVTYSVLIYVDVLVTLFFTMFFLLFVLYIKRGGKKYLVLSGIFGAFSFLTKTTGFVPYIFIFLVFVYELIKKRNFYEPFKKYFVLFLILILVPSTFLLRNYFYYKNPGCYFPYMDKIFSGNGCILKVVEFEGKYKYESRTQQVGTEQSVYSMGIMNYLDFAYGAISIFGIRIIFVVFALLGGLFLLLHQSDKISLFILFMLIMFLIIFYSNPGRAEDTARYLLIFSPLICLIAAKWLEEFYNFIERYQKYLALIVFIIIIIFGYQNLKDKLDTMIKVKQFSPTFFEACDWVKKNLPKNAVLSTVWSSRAAYNCQRDVRGNEPDIFLSTDVNYTKEVAKKLGITHLFIQKFSLSNEALSESFKVDSVQLFENHPETFKKVYENGLALDQCLKQGGCDGNIIYEIVY